VIQRRLDAASREIENYSKYDYILINDDLNESIKNLRAIVNSERFRQSGKAFSAEENEVAQRAERCRLANVRERVQRILDSFKE